MEKTDVIAVSESFAVALTLFASIIRWILGFLGLSKKQSIDILSTKSLKTLQEEYADKYRTAFLRTFEEEKEEDEAEKWNSNIDNVLRDKEALAEIVKDADNEMERKWKRAILIENTPRGNVFMFYDIYKQAFSYYCDQAVMPYDIMNAVAMKYVMMFRCRDFFMDSGVIPKKREDENTSKESEPSSSQPIVKKKEENQPFVKFKSYNTATKKVVEKTAEKTINRFLHLGGVRNWQPITVAKKHNPLNGFKTDMVPNNQKLSYAEYKKAQISVSSASSQ